MPLFVRELPSADSKKIEGEPITQLEIANADSAANHFISLALIVLGIFLFAYLGNYANVMAAPTYWSVGHLVVLSAVGLRNSTKNLPRSMLSICFAINACCVFYLLASSATYSLGTGNSLFDSPWLPIGLGFLAFRYPALIVWPALALRWTRLNVASETGWGQAGGADYIIIPDLALLLALFIAIFAVYNYMPRIGLFKSVFSKLNSNSFFGLVVLVTASVHLSNYFYSGFEKMMLPNSGLMTWALENSTYILSVNATYSNYFTIQNIFGEYTKDINYIIYLLNVPLNFAVLIGQLAALVCLLSLRKAALLTVFYDLMHGAIFLLTGILFWKWMVLNAAFIYSFQNIRNTMKVPLNFRLLCCMLVVVAPTFSNVVALAWFDTGALNEWHFEAKTSDGKTLRVPNAFFLDSSIDVAQERFSAPFTGFLPTQTWGTTADADIMRQVGRDCAGSAKPWTMSDAEKSRIVALLARQRRLALDGMDEQGRIAYDVYPHHILSASWLFREFSQVDLRTIETFVLVLQSKCTMVDENGNASQKIVGNARYEFPA